MPEDYFVTLLITLATVIGLIALLGNERLISHQALRRLLPPKRD